MTKSLTEAVEQLKRQPEKPVRVTVDGIVVELRAVRRTLGTARSATEVFAGLGPWAGESTAEIMAILAEARREGSQREVSDL